MHHNLHVNEQLPVKVYLEPPVLVQPPAVLLQDLELKYGAVESGGSPLGIAELGYKRSSRSILLTDQPL